MIVDYSPVLNSADIKSLAKIMGEGDIVATRWPLNEKYNKKLLT